MRWPVLGIRPSILLYKRRLRTSRPRSTLHPVFGTTESSSPLILGMSLAWGSHSLVVRRTILRCLRSRERLGMVMAKVLVSSECNLHFCTPVRWNSAYCDCLSKSLKETESLMFSLVVIVCLMSLNLASWVPPKSSKFNRMRINLRNRGNLH